MRPPGILPLYSPPYLPSVFPASRIPKEKLLAVEHPEAFWYIITPIRVTSINCSKSARIAQIGPMGNAVAQSLFSNGAYARHRACGGFPGPATEVKRRCKEKAANRVRGSSARFAKSASELQPRSISPHRSGGPLVITPPEPPAGRCLLRQARVVGKCPTLEEPTGGDTDARSLASRMRSRP